MLRDLGKALLAIVLAAIVLDVVGTRLPDVVNQTIEWPARFADAALGSFIHRGLHELAMHAWLGLAGMFVFWWAAIFISLRLWKFIRFSHSRR